MIAPMTTNREQCLQHDASAAFALSSQQCQISTALVLMSYPENAVLAILIHDSRLQVRREVETAFFVERDYKQAFGSNLAFLVNARRRN
eukprot:3610954-Amphidinium_carterae.2